MTLRLDRDQHLEGGDAPTPSESTSHRARFDEGGYVLPLTALLLIPLVTFAAFAIDLGAWYLQGSQQQKAAEAAALAGVVYLPDEAAAQAEARRVLIANGYRNSDADTAITYSVVGREQYRVTVEKKAVQFLSQTVMNEFDITRAATSRYIRPTPLGSPRNSLGSGDLITADPENIWLAINGACTSRENGDLINSEFTATYDGTRYLCTGTANPHYDPEGYKYAVTLQEPSPNAYDVVVFDGAYTPSDGGSAPDQGLGGTTTITTTFTLRRPDGSVIRTNRLRTNEAGWSNQWRSIGTIPANSVGTYVVQVQTDRGEANSNGVNSFAIQAWRSGLGSYSPCTTEVGMPGFSLSCPQVHGLNYVSVRTLNAGSVADFYLADVAASNGGKEMRITLFDPGEGADSIELLDPNGNPVNFRWDAQCGPLDQTPSGGCTGSTNALNVGGTGPQPRSSGYVSNSRYSDRLMELTVTLPTDYVAQFGTNTWWKVRYTYGGSSTPSDRTTWAIEIDGDPIRLTD